MSLSTLFIILAAIVSFVMTLVVIIRGQGPMCGPALLFITPLPLLVSIGFLLIGIIASFSAIATRVAAEPTALERFGATADSLRELAFASLSTVPGYILALLCLFHRSLNSNIIVQSPDRIESVGSHS